MPAVSISLWAILITVFDGWALAVALLIVIGLAGYGLAVAGAD